MIIFYNGRKHLIKEIYLILLILEIGALSWTNHAVFSIAVKRNPQMNYNLEIRFSKKKK